VVAAGLAPFAAGAALGPSGSGLPCPFREATGLPCPLCGASRSFALVIRGDADFLSSGAVWVLVAAVAVVAGISRVRWPLRGAAATAGSLAAVFAVAWAWALAHADTITDA
jgi:hypothetical protein